MKHSWLTIGFGAMILLTSGLGFVREMLMAHQFGASRAMDSFVVAYGIIYFAGMLLSPHIMQSMFIPGYLRARADSVGAASVYFHNMALLLLAAAAVVCAGLYVLCPFLLAWVAPGWDEAQRENCAQLVRIMLPLVVLYSLTNLMQALSNAHHRFMLPLSVQALSNAVIVLLIWQQAATNTEALSYVHVYASAAAMLLLIYSYVVLIPHKQINILQRGHLRQLHASSPLLLAALIDQCTLFLPRSMASLLAEGDITALNYAFRLMVLPVVIIASAIASVMFPSLSEEVRTHSRQRHSSIIRATCTTLLLLAPVSVVLASHSTAMVSLLFGYGAFDSHAVMRTALYLSYYAPGCVAYGLVLVMNRVFAAHGHYWSYALFASAGFVALLGISLYGALHHQGQLIALGFSISSWLAAICMLVYLWRRHGVWALPATSLWRIGAALAGAAIVLLGGSAQTLSEHILEAAGFVVLYALLLVALREPHLAAWVSYRRRS